MNIHILQTAILIFIALMTIASGIWMASITARVSRSVEGVGRLVVGVGSTVAGVERSVERVARMVEDSFREQHASAERQAAALDRASAAFERISDKAINAFERISASLAELQRLAEYAYIAVHDVNERTKLMEQLLKGRTRN